MRHTTESLDRSLSRQRAILRGSIILTPVDSIPLFYDTQEQTGFVHGLYISDKLKSKKEKQASIIQFAGREHATRDLNMIHKMFADALGAAECSLRLLSGLHAHIALFMSLAGIGDSVLLLPETAGGHFATKGILHRLGLRVFEMAVDFQRLCIDRIATTAILRRIKPDFIFVDRSEGLRYEDFGYLGGIEGPVKIFDASQFLPQIMFGHYPNPLGWGFDLLVFTLHKSFPGPQKAGVAARESSTLWPTLLKGLGELVSSAHTENSYRAGLVLAKESELKEYTSRLIATAIDLEKHLRGAGVPVFPRKAQGHPTWPTTHHLWLSLPSQERAFNLYQALCRARILTNYRLLPYKLGWGLRLGTTAATVRGLSLTETKELAHIIADVYKNGASAAARHRVRALARQMEPHAMTTWPLEPHQALRM